MRLNLNKLQSLVKQTINEEKATLALKEEIRRVLGPVVVTEGRKIEEVAAAANDRLDVLNRIGGANRVAFKPSAVVGFLNNPDPEIRKFAARVAPQRFLAKLVNDRSPEVRAALAERMSLINLREMIRKFPSDDQLRSIMRRRRLAEAGLPKPKVDDEPLSVNHEERMGDAAKTAEGPKLSDSWYQARAQQLLHDYGRTLDHGWENVAVAQLCRHTKATSGVEVDADKLLKTIKDISEEKDDRVEERDSLKETIAWLEAEDQTALIKEGTSSDDFVEEVDPIKEMLESNLTGEQFIECSKRVFRIQESTLPMGIRKHRLGEGNAKQVIVPVIGRLPLKRGFRAIDERALDVFCESWTRRQELDGEPLRLEWVSHPDEVGKIGFTVTLR